MERKICTIHELELNRPERCEIGPRSVLVIRTGEGIFAVDEFCSHEMESLAGGDVDERKITCPRHGSAFDLQSGRPTTFPATAPIKTYSVRIAADDVILDDGEQ